MFPTTCQAPKKPFHLETQHARRTTGASLTTQSRSCLCASAAARAEAAGLFLILTTKVALFFQCLKVLSLPPM